MISLWSLLIFLGTLCLVNLFHKLIEDESTVIFGVYSRKGNWYQFKKTIMIIVVQFRKWFNKLLNWRKVETIVQDLDRTQILCNHPQAIDAVYFNGANSDGYHLIIGTAHRPQGIVNEFLYLKHPDLGLLGLSRLPDTTLYMNHEMSVDVNDNRDTYGAEGLLLKPIRPMYVWRIRYNGPLCFLDKHGIPLTNKSPLNVNLIATWCSTRKYFHFDNDISAFAIGSGMAREPWSRDYFDNLKKTHQTHYEQHGNLYVRLSIDQQQQQQQQQEKSEKEISFVLSTFRDHSFGRRREWREFHRYALHFASFENGYACNVGILCIPHSFTRLVIGYLYPGKDYDPIAIDDCDFQLEYHGEGNDYNTPIEYAFIFQAGGQTYELCVKIKESPACYIGWDWEVKVIEHLAEFTLDGVPGWGATEWVYRNQKVKRPNNQLNDPIWVQRT